MKLLYRDFPELWAELKRLNDRVLYCKTLGQNFLEFKQMNEAIGRSSNGKNGLRKKSSLNRDKEVYFDKSRQLI